MWVKDREKMQQIVDKTGCKFAACMYTAKKGRYLKEQVKHVISDSDALSWAITDEPPADIEIRLENLMRKADSLDTPDKSEQVLANISEDNIREAVLKSYQQSIIKKQIYFDYNGIKDKGIRTRIRILVRMLFLS